MICFNVTVLIEHYTINVPKHDFKLYVKLGRDCSLLIMHSKSCRAEERDVMMLSASFRTLLSSIQY